MMLPKVKSSSKVASAPALTRPARSLTVMSALPPLPPLADVTTITCTTTKGQVTCVDDIGEAVRGQKLKDLQKILKPIAEAPAVTDTAKPVPAVDKPAEAPKAESKSVSEVPAPAKESESKAKPAVAPDTKPEIKPAVAEPKSEPKADAKPTVVADAKPAAPATPKPAVSDASTPDAKPAVISEAKPEVKAKPAVVADAAAKPAAPETPKPAVASPEKPTEAKPAVVSESKPAPPEPKAAVVTESKPAPQAPPAPQTISGDAKPPAPAQDKPSAPADAVKPPAPTQASGSGSPAPQSTPSSPDAAVPPPSSKPEASTTNVSSNSAAPQASNLALKGGKSAGPVLASPTPLAGGNDVRPLSVARGNDDSVSFSTGTKAAASGGNSTLGLDAPVSSAATPLRPTTAAGRFPGNVDPADFLPDDFNTVTTSVSPLKTAAMTSATKAKTINVMNEKGLIPGNLPPELGDILQLVNAVNTTPAKTLDLRVYPGNVPYESNTPTVLEFSPGNSAGKGESVNSVKMALTPGNVTPGVEDMLDFFGIGPGKGA